MTDHQDIRSSKTTSLLTEFVVKTPRWRNIVRAREQMKRDGVEPRLVSGGRRALLLRDRDTAIQIAEPSAEEEAHWEALKAEIDRRIPGGETL